MKISERYNALQKALHHETISKELQQRYNSVIENNTHVWVAVADELPWHDFYCREIQIRY